MESEVKKTNTANTHNPGVNVAGAVPSPQASDTANTQLVVSNPQFLAEHKKFLKEAPPSLTNFLKNIHRKTSRDLARLQSPLPSKVCLAS